MKILIIAERFYPEEFLINDLASEWISRGYSVDVLTQTPSYPFDKIFDGYKNKLFQTTNELEGVNIHRVRTFLGYNKSVFRKILNYVNFAALTSLWAVFKGGKYDRIFVYQTGPLTMATAALPLHYLRRKKSLIWTQDVWPYTVYAYGFKPTKIKSFLLDTFVKFIYSACDKISVSSDSFRKELADYSKKDISFFPQWTTNPQELPPKPQGEKIVFTFAGNIGKVQNIEMLVSAFGKLSPANAVLQIVGAGSAYESLKAKVKKLNCNNIILTGRQPQSKMREFFKNSDVLVISLKKEVSMWLPSKFPAYISTGRPIFGVVAGETADLIGNHDLGLAVPPDDESKIIEGFKFFLNPVNSAKFAIWRENNLKLSKTSFARDNIIDKITEKLFED